MCYQIFFPKKEWRCLTKCSHEKHFCPGLFRILFSCSIFLLEFCSFSVSHFSKTCADRAKPLLRWMGHFLCQDWLILIAEKHLSACSFFFFKLRLLKNREHQLNCFSVHCFCFYLLVHGSLGMKEHEDMKLFSNRQSDCFEKALLSLWIAALGGV